MSARDRRAVAASAGGFGAADIGLRVAPDLLGVGESIVLPALLGVTVQHVVSSSVVGVLVGMVMLVTPVAYLTPALFPRAFLTSRRNLVVRGFVGLTTLLVAVFVRETILVAVTDASTLLPVMPSVWSAVGVVATVTTGLAVLLVVPWDRFGTTPEPGSSAVGSRRPSDAGTATRLEPDSDTATGSVTGPWQRSVDDLEPPLGLLATGTLLVVGVGAVLATVSLLYPIPELLAVGAGLYVAVSPQQSEATDVVEPLILAVRSLWDGVSGATVFLYTVVVLYSLSVPGAEAVARAAGILSVFTQVGTAGGVVYTTAVLVPIAYAVKYVERSYRSVLTGGEVHVPWGAMVPVGVLSGLQVGAQKAGFDGGVAELVAAWTTPVWAVAILGAAVTLLLSVLPSGGGWLAPIAAAAMDRHDEHEGGGVNASAPTVAIPAGVVGLIVAQVVTRDLVAYHLTSALTAVGTLRRLAGGILLGGFSAGVVLVVPWVAVSVLAFLFGTLSTVVPGPLRRLLGS